MAFERRVAANTAAEASVLRRLARVRAQNNGHTSAFRCAVPASKRTTPPSLSSQPQSQPQPQLPGNRHTHKLSLRVAHADSDAEAAAAAAAAVRKSASTMELRHSGAAAAVDTTDAEEDPALASSVVERAATVVVSGGGGTATVPPPPPLPPSGLSASYHSGMASTDTTGTAMPRARHSDGHIHSTEACAQQLGISKDADASAVAAADGWAPQGVACSAGRASMGTMPHPSDTMAAAAVGTAAVATAAGAGAAPPSRPQPGTGSRCAHRRSCSYDTASPRNGSSGGDGSGNAAIIGCGADGALCSSSQSFFKGTWFEFDLTGGMSLPWRSDPPQSQPLPRRLPAGVQSPARSQTTSGQHRAEQHQQQHLQQHLQQHQQQHDGAAAATAAADVGQTVAHTAPGRHVGKAREVVAAPSGGEILEALDTPPHSHNQPWPHQRPMSHEHPRHLVEVLAAGLASSGPSGRPPHQPYPQAPSDHQNLHHYNPGTAAAPSSASTPSSPGATAQMSHIAPAWRPRASVAAFEMVSEPLGFGLNAEYVVYKIRVADRATGEEWTVARRFRTFEALASRLAASWPKYRSLVQSLPPKRIFIHTADVAFVNSRRAELDSYLQQLLGVPELAASEELRDFLQPGPGSQPAAAAATTTARGGKPDGKGPEATSPRPQHQHLNPQQQQQQPGSGRTQGGNGTLTASYGPAAGAAANVGGSASTARNLFERVSSDLKGLRRNSRQRLGPQASVLRAASVVCAGADGGGGAPASASAVAEGEGQSSRFLLPWLGRARGRGGGGGGVAYAATAGTQAADVGRRAAVDSDGAVTAAVDAAVLEQELRESSMSTVRHEAADSAGEVSDDDEEYDDLVSEEEEQEDGELVLQEADGVATGSVKLPPPAPAAAAAANGFSLASLTSFIGGRTVTKGSTAATALPQLSAVEPMRSKAAGVPSAPASASTGISTGASRLMTSLRLTSAKASGGAATGTTTIVEEDASGGGCSAVKPGGAVVTAAAATSTKPFVSSSPASMPLSAPLMQAGLTGGINVHDHLHAADRSSPCPPGSGSVAAAKSAATAADPVPELPLRPSIDTHQAYQGPAPAPALARSNGTASGPESVSTAVATRTVAEREPWWLLQHTASGTTAAAAAATALAPVPRSRVVSSTPSTPIPASPPQPHLPPPPPLPSLAAAPPPLPPPVVAAHNGAPGGGQLGCTAGAAAPQAPPPVAGTAAGVSAPLYELVDVLFGLQGQGFFRRQVIAVTRQVLSLLAGDAIDHYVSHQLRHLTSEHSLARALLLLHGVLFPAGAWFSFGNPPPQQQQQSLQQQHPAPAGAAAPQGASSASSMPPQPQQQQQPGSKVGDCRAPKPGEGNTSGGAGGGGGSGAGGTGPCGAGAPPGSSGAPPGRPDVVGATPAAGQYAAGVASPLCPRWRPPPPISAAAFLEPAPLPPVMAAETQQIADRVRARLFSRSPAMLVNVVGARGYARVLGDVWGLAQSRTMLLQLSYCLLQTLLVRLFPELEPRLRNLQPRALRRAAPEGGSR